LETYNFVRLPNYTYSKRSDKDLDDRVFSFIWALFILDPSLVTKYFNILEIDEQGRPMKIQSLIDNSDLIKQSPLLIGGSTTLKRMTQSSPSFNAYVGSPDPSSGFNVLEEDKQNLQQWLLSLDSQVDKKENFKKEDKQNIDGYRPVILF
jgi:hypothetical protein